MASRAISTIAPNVFSRSSDDVPSPFTTWSDAVRSLWIDTPANSDVWMSFIWCIVLTAIFAPLAVSRYRTVAAQ